MNKSAGALNSVMAKAGPLIGAYIGMQTLRQMKQIADEWTNIANRVKLFTESAEEAVAVQNKLFESAQRTRASMSATTELFQRLAQANKNLGLAQDDLLAVLETLNQTLVISGTSAESARAGLIQLGQAFASGQLRGEELRSVMEQMPRLTLALAEGLNTDVAGLRQFAEAGELTARRVIEAIQSQAGVIQEEFQGMTPTIEQAATVIENSFGLAIAQLDKATTASESLAKAILAVADAVNTIPEMGDGAMFQALFGKGATAEDLARIQREHPAPERVRNFTVRSLPFGMGTLPQQQRFGFGAGVVRPAGFGRTGPDVQERGASQMEAIVRAEEAQLRRLEAAARRAEQMERLLTGRGRTPRRGLAGFAAGVLGGQFPGFAPAPNWAAPLGETIRGSRLAMGGLPGTALMAGGADPRIAERARITQEIDDRQAKLNRTYSQTAGVLSRVAPELRGFFDAAASLAQGDVLGAIFNGIHGLLDVFGVARDSTDRLRESMEKLIEQQNKAWRSAEDISARLRERLDPGGFAELEKQALAPLARLMVILRQRDPGASFAERAEKAAGFLLQIEQTFGGSALTFRPAVAQFPLLVEALERVGISTGEWQQLLEDTFGGTGTMQDVIESFFGLDDAASKLVGTLEPLTREVRAVADVNEMRIRQQFATGFAQAGADPFLQRGAFLQAQAQIAALAAQEAAELAALRGGGTTAAGKVIGGGGTSGTTDPFSFASGDFQLVPEEVPWSDAVDFTQSKLTDFLEHNQWSEVVWIGGDVTKARQDWHKALDLRQSKLPDFLEVRGDWTDVVSIEGDVKKAEQFWAAALTLKQSAIGAFTGGPGYGNVVEVVGDEQKAFGAKWASVLHISRSPIGHFVGEGGYNDVVEIIGSLDKVSVPAANVLEFEPYEPSQAQVNEWLAIPQQIADVIRFGNGTVPLTDIISIDSTGFREAVTAAVNRALRDRTITNSGGGTLAGRPTAT